MAAEALNRALDNLETAAAAVKTAGSDVVLALHRAQATSGADPFMFQLAVFVLAVFVGYYVVWSVTPALHTPLMAVTNAISSVIIVGALLAVALSLSAIAAFSGFLALILASINIFGGFLVTQRMLAMYRKKDK